MKFRYVASTPAGLITRGVMEAHDKDDVGRQLTEQGLLIMSAHANSGPLRVGHASLSLQRISTLDKVLLARHLSLMIKSGLPIIESLQIIVDQSSHAALKKIVLAVIENVRNGNSLADSLARHPKVFGGLFINMVKIGEASGTLEKNLEYLAQQLEKDYELRQKIRSAMLYPLIILIATVLLGSGLSVFVLPKLVKLFEGLHIALPLSTKIFLAVAAFLSHWGLLIFGAVVVFLMLVPVIRRIHAIKLFLNRAALAIPLMKNIVLHIMITRFCRTLSVLLASGLPIIEGLAITKDTLDNLVYEREITYVISQVEKGKPLGETLAGREKYFPKIVSRMMSVGEKTGRLDETLSYLSTFYDSEVDAATKNLATVIEPILLVIIGLVVGGLGIAIITPIYQLSGSLGR